MEVNDALIDKLAQLSKLSFESEAKESIKADMSRMLDFVDKLNEIDTDGVEPLIFMSDEVNVLRKDDIERDITQEEALKNAPQHDSDYFKVPKVVSKK